MLSFELRFSKTSTPERAVGACISICVCVCASVQRILSLALEFLRNRVIADERHRLYRSDGRKTELKLDVAGMYVEQRQGSHSLTVRLVTHLCGWHGCFLVPVVVTHVRAPTEIAARLNRCMAEG